MNLGGIKVSSADIERLVSTVPGVATAAAIAVEPPGGGPSRLVIVAVPAPGHTPDVAAWRSAMQGEIRTHLNPLFKIHEVVVADDLPRTASAKVMRRTLRARFSS
jgi:acetyl-CoA synthetase